jgi:hypothetical protein
MRERVTRRILAARLSRQPPERGNERRTEDV